MDKQFKIGAILLFAAIGLLTASVVILLYYTGDMSPILILIFILSALGVGAGIGWSSASVHHRLKALEEEVRRRNQVAIDAHGRMRAHHSYNTLAAIEDSTSLLMDAALEMEAMQARISTAMAILKVLHESPTGYEPKKKDKHE